MVAAEVDQITPRSRSHLLLAEEYAEAASRLLARGVDDDVNAEVVGRPFFMLVAHAFELSFKVVLIRAGWGEERLMMLGHGLERGHAAAMKAGLVSQDPTALADLVEVFDGPVTFQAFRYPQPISWDEPKPSTVLVVLAGLLRDVGSKPEPEPTGRARTGAA